MKKNKIPMSQVRTISGIPDDLWEDARNEYDTISGKIKELLEEDLEQNKPENSNYVDILKNAGLTKKQLQTARDLMTKGGVKKNPQQLGNILRNNFAEKEYREKARKVMIKNSDVPFEEDGKGIKAIDTKCPECGSKSSLQALRKTSFNCPKCKTRLYDLEA